MKKLTCLLLALCMASCLFAGCAAPAQTEPTPTQAAAPHTEAPAQTEAAAATRSFTDSCGRTVELPAEITRVAPSGSMAQMILFSIAPDALMGLSNEFTDSAKAYTDEKYWNLPVFGTFYGKNVSLNLEALLAASPQVIIDIGEAKGTIAEDMDGIQAQTGIPTIFIECSLENTGAAYRTLGELLGKQEEGETLAQYCEDTLAMAREKSAAIPQEERVTLYYGEGDNGLTTIPSGSFHNTVIELVGIDNVAVLDTTSGAGSEISMEQLLLWNPDVVLFNPGSVYAAVGSDPLWADVTAVQEGRYYEVPTGPYNWLSRPPSINRFLGVRWLGNLIYPDIYELDIAEEAKTFYSLFYHCDLSDEQLTALLANSSLK